MLPPRLQSTHHDRRGIMRLQNKVALISGGARGMGAAEAKLLAGKGAKVVIGDVLEEEGRRTEAQIWNRVANLCFLDLTSSVRLTGGRLTLCLLSRKNRRSDTKRIASCLTVSLSTPHCQLHNRHIVKGLS